MWLRIFKYLIYSLLELTERLCCDVLLGAGALAEAEAEAVFLGTDLLPLNLFNIL